MPTFAVTENKINMKKYRLAIIALFFSFEISIAQEVASGLFFDNETSLDEIIAKNNSIKLGIGQWTDFDGAYVLPRFKNAMEYIVINNKTNLLADLAQISSYYSYLDRHPKVVESGVLWQHEASNITLKLQLVPLEIDASLLVAKAKIYFTEDDLESKKLLKIIEEGISTYGEQFINGTASKRIVADVTKFFYSPLIQGKIPVPDPFKFDADILYKEQFDILQHSYYDKFNEFDKEFLIGVVAEIYAKVNLADMADFEWADISLKNPKDRLYIGLRIMGYSKEQINGYIAKLK